MMTSAVPNPTNPPPAPLSSHRRRQRYTAHQRMQRHAHSGRSPRQSAGGLFGQGVATGHLPVARFVVGARFQAVVVLLRRAFRHVMMVMGEEALE